MKKEPKKTVNIIKKCTQISSSSLKYVQPQFRKKLILIVVNVVSAYAQYNAADAGGTKTNLYHKTKPVTDLVPYTYVRL